MAESEEPSNPNEQAAKGGRNTVVSLWLLVGIAVVASVLVTLLIGRRPLSGTGAAASTTPGPAGLASSLPNVNAAVPDPNQPASAAPNTPPPTVSAGNKVPVDVPRR
jgi:hypothetical protein